MLVSMLADLTGDLALKAGDKQAASMARTIADQILAPDSE